MVQIGSRVCIRDADGECEFQVVEPEEADALADRVSRETIWSSPAWTCTRTRPGGGWS